MVKVAQFLVWNNPRKCFILRGYAGTGKTTLVSACIAALPKVNLASIQLAPTGRAAKVIAGYSGKPAYTIHKQIYKLVMMDNGGSFFTLDKNPHRNTIFVVDESSMISNDSSLGSMAFQHRSLLSDLVEYVYNGKNCSLLFVGDVAQLPPVGLEHSPALDEDALSFQFKLDPVSIEMKEVVRQAADSGILANATSIRNLISGGKGSLRLKTNVDVEQISGVELQEYIEESYRRFGMDGVIVVCRSNKAANMYNQQIRNRILYREGEIEAGDYLMIVKNNYFWLPADSKLGFLANGDIAEVQKVSNRTELYGFQFADVHLRLIDYPNEPPIETRILLDALYANGPALPSEDGKRLFHEVSLDYGHIADAKLRKLKVFQDPFYNALQVKYAYGVTCHKAQGGQWKCVFVDMGFLPEGGLNREFYRWLYTAATRATDKLYLVNFDKSFF